jgi:biotin/methionine sulfoxide reductase
MEAVAAPHNPPIEANSRRQCSSWCRASRVCGSTARWIRVWVSARGKVAGREAILINPDTAPCGIAEGCVVRVHNGRGACLAGAVLSDAVRPGVVQLSCGAWYDPADDTADALCRHGNANVLTRDHGTSKLAQGPSSATTTVEIECFAAAPPVGAFIPPPVSQRP